MNRQPRISDQTVLPEVSVVRFLDGKMAGTAAMVAAGLREGRYRFHGSELTTDRHGAPYYLKPVSPERWASGDVPEWTAALDDDPYDV